MITPSWSSHGTLRLAVRVKPGARRARVGGRYDGPLGPALVVAVTAPPVEGQANAAVLTALAQALALRIRSLSLVSGSRGRDKIVQVTAPDAREQERVRDLVEQLLTGSGPAA